jgi:hypothetical protein
MDVEEIRLNVDHLKLQQDLEMVLILIILVGAVKIWDVRQHEKPVAVMAPKDGEPIIDTWTVAFGI